MNWPSKRPNASGNEAAPIDQNPYEVSADDPATMIGEAASFTAPLAMGSVISKTNIGRPQDRIDLEQLGTETDD